MKHRLPSTLLALLAAAVVGRAAAVPPADQLLPADTLAVLSVPDWAKLDAARKESPFIQIWNDESMRPFREKLLTKLTNEVLAPIEQQLGVKLADYADLLQGQFTAAITQNGWKGSVDPLPGLVVLLDAKDKGELLKKNLADVKKRLTDAGKTIRTDKIRDVEFTTLVINLDELTKGMADGGNAGTDAKPKEGADAKPAADAKPGSTLELHFGQVDSLLLVGTSTKDLEKILARLAGSGAGFLAEVPAFETDAREFFRDTLTYGWIHFAPLAEILGKIQLPGGAGGNPMMPQMDKLLETLGVNGLRTLAFNEHATPEGLSASLFLGSPEDKRKGLLRLLATQTKDAAPPAFVPADSVQFSRWRGDGQQFWNTIETMANDLAPGMLGFVIAQLEAAMREKDPAFDFKKNLVGNLGDDFISYQKAPRGDTLEDLSAPPAISLLASANPEQLMQGVRATLVLLPPPFNASALKEREFLGRKIYSLPLPAMPTGADDKAAERKLNFAVNGGYLAISADAGMIEEYLRSSETKPKPLAETPGLADASQKVGGMGTGLFGFQNDAENMRVMIEVLRKNPDLFATALAFSPLAPKGGQPDKVVKEWVDFSLLPPFEKVAKYFGITVYAGHVSKTGYTLKVFTPKPPGSK